VTDRLCETCRHWRLDYETMGVCAKITEGDSDKAVLQFTSYVEFADPELLTAPDFFCALHEPKP
jgi:hypothetical protein